MAEATTVTAIPNSGETGRWLWVCVSALSILDLGVSPFPFLSFLLSTRKPYHYVLSTFLSGSRRRRRSFHPPTISLPLSCTFSSSFFLRPNPLGQANPPRRSPRFHLPLVLFRCPCLSLSVHFCLSNLHGTIRRADPRPRTQSPHRSPAFITRYEDSPASSRFTRTYSTCTRSSDTTRTAAIYNIGKLCECRITPDYIASPVFLISSIVRGVALAPWYVSIMFFTMVFVHGKQSSQNCATSISVIVMCVK